jgi:hypothetical protein
MPAGALRSKENAYEHPGVDAGGIGSTRTHRAVAMRGGGAVDVLLVVLPDPQADVHDVERLVRRLRADLADLDVDDVHAVANGDLPEGAKAADPVTVGAIMLAMSASGGLFTSVVGAVRDVLAHHAERHKVVMTIGSDSIELAGATDEQRDDLVRAFVDRHTSD